VASIANGFVEYIARKTREGTPVTVRVPMNSLAKEIAARYASNNPKDRLLPYYTDQSYNRSIKRIFLAAGLKRYVQVLDSKTREPKQVRLCDIASSHMARRTFIGNIYKQVKDQNLVSALPGHKEGSRAFARYRSIDDDMKKEMVQLLE